jgi:hypothetical protein
MSLFVMMCRSAKKLILGENNLGKRTKKLSLDSNFSFLIEGQPFEPIFKTIHGDSYTDTR